MTLLLLQGCGGSEAPGRMGEGPLPLLVSQSVTATVKREALRLVRLETEHESFLSTPEHPFAVPGSGWLSAGRLVPGDWVVSERFGAVRLLSVRSEPATRPVEVFNLSVASSHSYFVGTDRVLVHNTKCQGIPSESDEAAIERLTRERDEILRELAELTRTAPTSPRIAELKAQRKRAHQRLRRVNQRKERGVPNLSQAAQTRTFYETERDAALKALEDAQNELAALTGRPSHTEAEQAARKAELEKQISALRISHDRSNRILTWQRELAELDQLQKSASDADRRRLEGRKRELTADLKREQKRASSLKNMRKQRAAREGREQEAKSHLARWRRQVRSAAYLADTERPRDPLELLEEELAGLLQDPPSESRDARIHHLTDWIDTMKRLVEVRKRKHNTYQTLSYARRRRRAIAAGEESSKFDQKIEREERTLHAVRIEVVQLRVRERLLAQLDRTPWAGAPESVDEGRLREFEAELAAGLENEQQLTDIERALDAMEPTYGDLQEAVLDEARDVDDILSEREELIRQPPSPERATGLESSYSRLVRELREERAAVEVAVSALVNEYAHIQTTQAGSSQGPSWQERLRAIQAEQGALLARWRAGLQARLDSAQTQLRLMRGIERLRDEEIEAELGREIALLEGELRSSG